MIMKNFDDEKITTTATKKKKTLLLSNFLLITDVFYLKVIKNIFLLKSIY